MTRDISASTQVRLVPASDDTPERISGQASSDVQLTDYQVSISTLVRLKASNTIRINVTIRAFAR